MLMVPANTLFARVGLDLAGPLPMTQKGNKHILNIICWFTKFVVSVAVPDTKAETIARAFFTNCYLKFGGCVELVTDNASAFTSEFFREFCSLLYINKKYATPHWSQGNAATERTFRTYHNILSKYITRDQPDFDEFLDAASFCYNTSVHTSTGESPFFLMYGRDPIFCIDQILDPRVRDPVALSDRTEFKQRLVGSLRRAWEAAESVHRQAQLKMKEQYDKRVRPLQIQVGDRVLIRSYDGKVGTSKKFLFPWKGIFRVVQVEGVHVTVQSCTSPQAKLKQLHVNQVKKCFEFLGPACTAPEIPAEEEEALQAAGAEEVQQADGVARDMARSASPERRAEMTQPDVQVGRETGRGNSQHQTAFGRNENDRDEPRYGLRPRVPRVPARFRND